MPLHPAVVRLLAYILRTGQAYDIPVAVCGEIASDRRGIERWIEKAAAPTP